MQEPTNAICTWFWELSSSAICEREVWMRPSKQKKSAYTILSAFDELISQVFKGYNNLYRNKNLFFYLEIHPMAIQD